MRITDNMRFNTTLRNLFSTQSQYNYLMEKIASQKKVNRASDDPVAATRIINIRQSKAAIEQYMKNVDSGNASISATESTLSGVRKLLDTANEIAIGAMGADAATREISAANIQAIIDSMLSLANTKWGDSYLFSGSKTSTEPFSATFRQARIEAVEQAGNNVFNGTVESSATYSGTTDKRYALKITTGGSLAEATAQISTDGGATWNGTDLSMTGGYINLGDGVTLTLGAGTFIEDDIFYIDANAATSVDAEPPPPNPPVSNFLHGTVAIDSSVSYSGGADKTYTVQITTGGALAAATAKFSTDGGTTWQNTTADGINLSVAGSLAGGIIDLGEGVVLTFDDNNGAYTFDVNDTMEVEATAADGSVTVGSPTVPPPGATDFFSHGTVTSTGPYSGATDKTYTIEITANGDLDAATLRFKTNGGGWQTTAGGIDLSVVGAMASGVINLGEGVFLTFDDSGGTKTFTAGDTFVVNAYAEGNVEPVEPDVDNSLLSTGTVTSSVTYSGATNNTYVVKITGNKDLWGNAIAGVDTAQFSTNGGRTWSGTIPSAVGNDRYINLGDNVKITLEDAVTKIFGTNDIFYVNATAPGYYKGDDENLSMTIDRGTNFTYNITGAEAFAKVGGVDIFKTLTALKEALDKNNDSEIYAQRSNIERAGSQILLSQSRCGMKANHLEVVTNNLVQFNETLSFLQSEAQDADITELGVKLLMSETALKTTYAMAARIGEATILNYLK